jgi:hypothetical protein
MTAKKGEVGLSLVEASERKKLDINNSYAVLQKRKKTQDI